MVNVQLENKQSIPKETFNCLLQFTVELGFYRFVVGMRLMAKNVEDYAEISPRIETSPLPR